MHNFSPSLIFPLPLEGFWPCRNTLVLILLLSFTLTDFLWTPDVSASISSADDSWNHCAICMWTYQLTWTQLVTHGDQNSDADSVRTPLTSAWRQCCTYITPTTGLSGPQCRNCWTVTNGWQTMTDSSAKKVPPLLATAPGNIHTSEHHLSEGPIRCIHPSKLSSKTQLGKGDTLHQRQLRMGINLGEEKGKVQVREPRANDAKS